MERRSVNDIKPHSLNPRGAIEVDDGIQELAASIKTHGLLSPLVVTPQNVLIAGHRRLRACQIAGVREVDVIVKDISETEQIAVLLVENLQREDLTPLQMARGYQNLIDRGLSIKEIAARVGISDYSITRVLKILKLAPELHRHFGDHSLPIEGITALLTLPIEKQIEIGNRAGSECWSVEEIKRECAKGCAPAQRLTVTLCNKANSNGHHSTFLDQAKSSLEAVKKIVKQRRTGGSKAPSVVEAIFEDEPTFDDYVSARKVVLYEYEQMRRSKRYGGNLNVASDEMVANIVRKSCAYFQAESTTVEPGAWMSFDQQP